MGNNSLPFHQPLTLRVQDDKRTARKPPLKVAPSK